MKQATDDDALAAEVLRAARNVRQRKELPCAVAFDLARCHEVPITRIGEICNANGIKIARCQLGCF